MRFKKRLFAAIALAAPLLAGGFAFAIPQMEDQVPSIVEDWKVLDDEWMILEIDASRVGWMNTITDGSGEQIRTRSITEMKIGRGDATVAIRMETVFIETADGKPIKVVSTQNMAATAVETSWEFDGDKIRQVSKQGERETVTQLNAPKEAWLTPHAADEFSKKQRAAGAAELTYRTLDPQSGVKPVNVVSKRAGETEYEIDGAKTKVEIWKTKTDIMPIEAIEYMTADGDLVYQEVPTGMGKIVMRTATKAVALADVEGGAPEMMARSFIKPDKPIEHSMKTVRAKLKLTAREGELTDLPTAGAQRVERSEDGKTAILTIDINDNVPATDEEKSSEDFTKSSAMLDYTDELVSKLAARQKDETDSFKKAEALRKLVNKHISKKGMATAFATASETARTRTGDCSEHGVLLAALLRAQGIPSRTAMGLVYVDQFMGEEGIFGWHMWTQGLIDGKWVDFDATLPVRYNAVHILTATSSMADGSGQSDMASIMQLLGNLDVEVLEVEHSE